MVRQFEFINDEINFLNKCQKDTITNLKTYLREAKKKDQEEKGYWWSDIFNF